MLMMPILVVILVLLPGMVLCGRSHVNDVPPSGVTSHDGSDAPILDVVDGTDAPEIFVSQLDVSAYVFPPLVCAPAAAAPFSVPVEIAVSVVPTVPVAAPAAAHPLHALPVAVPAAADAVSAISIVAPVVAVATVAVTPVVSHLGTFTTTVHALPVSRAHYRDHPGWHVVGQPWFLSDCESKARWVFAYSPCQ